MDRETFRKTVAKLPYGKRLPTALYVLRPSDGSLPPELTDAVRRAEIACAPDPSWNILKLHSDQFALTFLSYRDFDTDPHPALAEATKINLSTGSVVRTDYRSRPNPPILHRKETFLPVGDPRGPLFAALTKQEEDAGLFRDPSRIGHRLQWQTQIKRHGLGYDGHVLVKGAGNSHNESLHSAELPVVERHRTAIKRYDLSKPVKILLEHGLLRKNKTFFDYGCGHGMDVEALRGLGYNASGWDPAFHPKAPKTGADVVNLGYVLNVIENPAERMAALREAYGLANQLLLVSTLVAGQETDAHVRPYGDGFLTKTNTFQKFYVPGELETVIEESLDAEVSTLALGVCAVFRNPDEAELFEAGRNRRRIDWSEIGAHLKFSVPTKTERRRVGRYELHKDLFDEFWRTILDLGRLPEIGEFDRLLEVRNAGGSLKKALALVTVQNGPEFLELARKARTEDALVYLAMTNFRKHFLRREIPLRTKNDIRAFFGDVPTAKAQARELLFAAGDPGEIDLACEAVEVGWQDQNSLIVHRTLLDRLPPILRIYVYCAAHRYGDPAQADLIKIHKHSGKVTFQHYDDFEGKALPELQTRIKVSLRSLFVEVFDHTKGPQTQLLYFKERFLLNEHPSRAAMKKFSAKLRSLGLNEETIGLGPDKETFLRLTRGKRIG